MSEVVELEGVVSAGLGEGTRLTQIDWVLQQFHAKLGFLPHPGTFNVHMATPMWEGLRLMCDSYGGIAIVPAQGYCAARCYRVRVDDRVDGALVVPDVADYPSGKVEIVAPVSVRLALGVGDGDTVRLQVALE